MRLLAGLGLVCPLAVAALLATIGFGSSTDSGRPSPRSRRRRPCSPEWSDADGAHRLARRARLDLASGSGDGSPGGRQFRRSTGQRRPRSRRTPCRGDDSRRDRHARTAERRHDRPADRRRQSPDRACGPAGRSRPCEPLSPTSFGRLRRYRPLQGGQRQLRPPGR